MKNEKREIACCCGTHVFRCILRVPNGFHVWGCEARENAREKTFWASYMNPSTDGVFGANFTGIVRKYWIIDATPMRCLTAFKTENPDARKKTKRNHRGYHFSFLPSSFHTIDSRAIIKSHPGILPQSHDSLENWYARSGASVTWESTWTMKRATSCLKRDF